jgi:trans-aconitate methyltransferase
MTTWDVATYDTSFSYVSAFGTAVLELLDPQPGERILDLGCGSGDLTAAIAGRGADVIGVDSSPEMIARAREQFPHLELQLADGHELELHKPVDAVFSNAALHWMTDPDAVLAGVRTVLRDGGRFVAEMGAAGNVAQLVGALRAAAFRLDLADDVRLPWYFPTPAEHASRLEQVGFRVRLMQYIDRPTPLVDCRDGAADWWRMFGGSVLEQFPAARVDELLTMVNEIARPQLVDKSGVWIADYVRLRFVAEAG